MPERLTLGERVDRAFDPNGALASAINAFEIRGGQRDMAVAVADIFEGARVRVRHWRISSRPS